MATKYRATCTDCPFTNTYISQAKADYALRQHSCELQLRRAELRAAGEARKASIDRAPKPCLHKEADHQHGTYACYVLDFCRCTPCGKANSDYEADRVRQQAYGRWNGLVDAEPARQHVRSLTEQGMGLKRIVAVSDVSHGQLWKLMYGKQRADGSRAPSRRIRPDTERRILAVKLDLAAGVRVESFGAARRIQALVALGWSMSKIAAHLGIMRSNFTPVAHGRTTITVAHDKAIRALYDGWSMKLPPQETHRDKIAASRARNQAKALGWLPPLAWDDDPKPTPAAGPYTGGAVDAPNVDESAIERRMHGDKTVALTTAEKGELVRRMLAQGISKKDIERRTGVHTRREYITTPQGVSA